MLKNPDNLSQEGGSAKNFSMTVLALHYGDELQ